jgi:hypothetical protein
MQKKMAIAFVLKKIANFAAENLSKSPKICQNHRKFVKIAENSSKIAGNWSKSPNIGKNRRKLVKNRRKLVKNRRKYGS